MAVAIGRGIPLGATIPASFYIWLAALAGVVLVGGAVAVAVRRRALRDDRPDPGTFMDELRGARDRGEISPEEFDRVRKTIGHRMRAGLGEGKDPG